MGGSCWEKGCDVKTAEKVCQETNEPGTVGQGRLARIDSPFENYQVGKLLQAFGTFEPWKKPKTFYWFYNALKESKDDYWDSTYTWPDGRETNFTNWYIITF